MEYHLSEVSEIAQSLNSSPSGLDSETARQTLEEYGINQIEDSKKKTVWQILIHHFTDVMILVLIAAALISGLVGELKSTYVIIAIIILNAIVGFIQEYRAEKAMEALKLMSASYAKVKRDNQIIVVAASDLVPGDLVMLEAENIVPADIRFIETYSIKIDESSLTGESINVEKNADALSDSDLSLGDRLNMGYKGTLVTNGRASAYVVATGMKTELGKIATLIQTGETVTPLQKRLANFGKGLSIAAFIICIIFFVAGWIRGEPLLNLLLVSISLAVAAIPEALPALVTIALALGAKQLIKSNALVRKLTAVEALGSVTYICTDKTGTLTVNEMTVQEVFESPKTGMPDIGINNMLLLAMALNNDASENQNKKWLGDSTEIALARFAQNKKHERPVLEAKFPRIDELPFDSQRKCMTTIHRTNHGILSITKGAVESLFEQLDSSQNVDLPDLQQRVDEMASNGFRTLGYACKILPDLPETIEPATVECDLTFIGWVGLIDPIRAEAREAVSECKAAGIIPVMITGDNKLTAKAVAESLGIISSSDNMILTGPELSKLDKLEFDAIVEQVRVYARVDPEQKLQIITALQARDQFVAMTGDGVNDAPSLKIANIGIAMGINGTEVAKEAAHMILFDDNFTTIVKAVKHGRQIFDNILKFIRYILSGNAGEIWAIFLAPFLGCLYHYLQYICYGST